MSLGFSFFFPCHSVGLGGGSVVWVQRLTRAFVDLDLDGLECVGPLQPLEYQDYKNEPTGQNFLATLTQFFFHFSWFTCLFLSLPACLPVCLLIETGSYYITLLTHNLLYSPD